MRNAQQRRRSNRGWEGRQKQDHGLQLVVRDPDVEYCNREGIGLAGIVQYLGIDFRKRFKNLRRMRKGERRKCKQRISIIKKTNVFAHKHIIEGTRKGLEMGVVPGRAWSGNALGLPLSQELALRRQLASAAGNKLGW